MEKDFDVFEEFGSNVFNDYTMRQRLPKDVYKKLKQTIEEGKELDYLQVFKVRKCKEGIVIEHSQEVPEYKEKYVIALDDIEINESIKVFFIDDYKYSTMMLAREYQEVRDERIKQRKDF